MLGFHTGSEESWSGQQQIAGISQASKHTSIRTKQIFGQKIPFKAIHTSYKHRYPVRL